MSTRIETQGWPGANKLQQKIAGIRGISLRFGDGRLRLPSDAARTRYWSMIPKSGYRFSEKIMLKQQAEAKWRFD
ncbi:MAG: hypothetical protein J2P55_04330 [Rhizobiales bacterium]|nr:hypothetical protein [Hyphomicrobiales bacterium]